MWVALAAGGGAKAPGGRATLVPEDLIDGRAVLVGQGRRIGRRITILLGVCLGWGGVFFGGGGGDNKVEASSERREGQEMDSVQGERK